MDVEKIERGMIVSRPAGAMFWCYGPGVNGLQFGDTSYWERTETQPSGRVVHIGDGLSAIDFGEKDLWLASIYSDLDDRNFRHEGNIILACKYPRATNGTLMDEYSPYRGEYDVLKNKHWDDAKEKWSHERTKLMSMIDGLMEENHKLRLENIGVSS